MWNWNLFCSVVLRPDGSNWTSKVVLVESVDIACEIPVLTTVSVRVIRICFGVVI